MVIGVGACCMYFGDSYDVCRYLIDRYAECTLVIGIPCVRTLVIVMLFVIW